MAGIFDVVKRIADHLVSGVHALAQPSDWNTTANKPTSFTPATHGNAEHSSTFATTTDVANHNNNDVHVLGQPPQTHTYASHSTPNLLASITPSFSGFSTNPATNGDITTETNDALTTSGVTEAAPNAYITYDLGTVKNIMCGLRVEESSGRTIQLEASHDNITFSQLDSGVAGQGEKYQLSAFAYCRYIRLNFVAGSIIKTLTNVKMYAYTVK